MENIPEVLVVTTGGIATVYTKGHVNVYEWDWDNYEVDPELRESKDRECSELPEWVLVELGKTPEGTDA